MERFQIRWCWWGMMETKCVGDNYKIPLTSRFSHQHPQIVTTSDILLVSRLFHCRRQMNWIQSTIFIATTSYHLKNLLIINENIREYFAMGVSWGHFIPYTLWHELKTLPIPLFNRFSMPHTVCAAAGFFNAKRIRRSLTDF